ncbi:hypothetical protein [Paenibacillus koleovorans]|uniref:hypothetical protein n=1 Tax=Paenibacillus koleovorans TaxID=121608 RepID=UPI000FD92C7C|nr:hypothetical protein [Paenibacillus koleovorans]
MAYRRGGGVYPTLYDGDMQSVASFPMEGYVVHTDLTGSGTEQVIVYGEGKAELYASRPIDIAQRSGGPLLQPKRLSSPTLYPGGEVHTK